MCPCTGRAKSRSAVDGLVREPIGRSEKPLNDSGGGMREPVFDRFRPWKPTFSRSVNLGIAGGAAELPFVGSCQNVLLDCRVPVAETGPRSPRMDDALSSVLILPPPLFDAGAD